MVGALRVEIKTRFTVFRNPIVSRRQSLYINENNCQNANTKDIIPRKKSIFFVFINNNPAMVKKTNKIIVLITGFR